MFMGFKATSVINTNKACVQTSEELHKSYYILDLKIFMIKDTWNIGLWRFRYFSPEDGGSTVLRNVGIQPPHYTPQQSSKPRSISSRPWERQIWYESCATHTGRHHIRSIRAVHLTRRKWRVDKVQSRAGCWSAHSFNISADVNALRAVCLIVHFT